MTFKEHPLKSACGWSVEFDFVTYTKYVWHNVIMSSQNAKCEQAFEMHRFVTNNLEISI